MFRGHGPTRLWNSPLALHNKYPRECLSVTLRANLPTFGRLSPGVPQRARIASRAKGFCENSEHDQGAVVCLGNQCALLQRSRIYNEALDHSKRGRSIGAPCVF
jgi:hypothetical protein